MRFLKADQIFDGKHFLANNAVLVLNGENLLTDIISEKEAGEGKIERLRGIITPGFVNAHCHLELSHLKKHIPQKTGLPEFARNIITQRNKEMEQLPEAMLEADKEMWAKGIVAVGDISNAADSFEIKTKSKIRYFTFVEVLGLNPAAKETAFQKGQQLLEELQKKGLHGSLAPHAPYSTSLELIAAISEYNKKNNLTLSIHNQECDEENKFFNDGSGAFADLYKFLNLNISFFQARGGTSLQNYYNALNGTRSMLVHNTVCSAQDLELLSGKNVYWCFCPGANLYIEGRLPDYPLFKDKLTNICVGTDSLASNLRLDVICEINLILQNTKAFLPVDLLRAITWNGAEALNLQDEFGSLIKGKNTGLNLLRLDNRQFTFIEKIC